MILEIIGKIKKFLNFNILEKYFTKDRLVLLYGSFTLNSLRKSNDIDQMFILE